MKKINLIMPIAASIAAITPTITMVSCGNKQEDFTVDNKSKVSNNSYIEYKFKMAKIPTNKKVTINVINDSTQQEQIVLYNTNSSTNIAYEATVGDDGTFSIYAGYSIAPVVNSVSKFGLSFTYLYGEETCTSSMSGLQFTYNVNYGDDLSKEQYQAKQEAPSEDHWKSATNVDQVAQIYVQDILNNPEIFQDDARYSTSTRILAAAQRSEEFKVDSFKSFFNDIFQDEEGLYVHMNYEMKGTSNDSIFSFKQTTRTFKFKKFDVSFSFETANGYTFSTKTVSTGDYTTFQISDPHSTYDLNGRFKGKFTYTITEDGGSESEAKTIEYDGLIGGESNSNEETDKDICNMFAAGVIHLTYDFDWGVTPELTILSPYAKNAK